MADNSNQMVFARAALELLRNTPGWRGMPPKHREWAAPAIAAIEAGDRGALRVARGNLPDTGEPPAYNFLNWITYIAIVYRHPPVSTNRRESLRRAARAAGVDMVALDTLLALFPLPALQMPADYAFRRYELDDWVLS